MPPYLQGSPFPVGGKIPLLDVDFSSWSAGFYDASAFHAQTYTAPDKNKLDLLRDYTGYPTTTNGSSIGESHQGETVQTSESSLLRSASTTQTDVACVGKHEVARAFGLVVQPAVMNYAPDQLDAFTEEGARRYTNADGWTGGVGTFTLTTSYSDSPDGSGTGCTRVELTSGYTPYGNLPGSGSTCFTSWQRSKDSSNGLGDMKMEWGEGGSPTGLSDQISTTRSASNTWARMSLIRTSGRSLTYAWPVHDVSKDVLVDYIHVNAGEYPTEAIPTACGARPADKLRYETGSELVADNGQIKFYAKITPKLASTQTPVANTGTISGTTTLTAWTLFQWGSANTNYARLRVSDRKLAVKIASGTEYVSTNAVSWSQYDVVEIYAAVGNGIASVAKYRINGDAWTDLVLATVPDVPSPGSSEVIFFSNGAQNGDTTSWCAWVHRLSMLKTGGY